MTGRAESQSASQITAAFITPECRDNRGTDGAWNEAVQRLRAEYDAVLEGWAGHPQQPTLNLVLMMSIEGNTQEPESAPRTHRVKTYVPRPRPEGETEAKIRAAVARPGSNESKHA